MGLGLLPCAIALALLTLPACQRRSTFLNQNDELRRQNLALNQQIADLEQQLALRQSELEAMDDRPGENPLPGVEPTQIAGIVIGRYSGGIDLTGDGLADELRVYLRPVDRQGRFMSAAGSARVRLIHTPDDGQPTTLVDIAYDPDAFDDAYRSGFTGTHYTLEAKLADNRPASALLQVTFTEAARGLTYTAERIVPLRGVERSEPEKQ